ncbi:MAG: RHS repeat-associated core domain-containing protein, partial [Caldilineaceae bacterium]|nr:RHS repeat-associated core domain-containing protein [Caldilineaceae bacterium]
RDGVGGAYYNYQRWYASKTGRYITPDPIGLAGGPNPYAYAGSNPMVYTDRSGLLASFLFETGTSLLPIDSVTVTCLQDPAFCAEIFGHGAVGADQFCVADEELRGDLRTAGAYATAATLFLTGGRGILFAAKKLPRFNGPKPSYHVNPAHVPGQRGFNPKKTPLPKDAESVFKAAVPNDSKNPTAWFGKNADGQIYRFSLSNDGTAHFSGIDGVGDGVRNLTKYALDRLNGL